ncbi:unnamed protein product [Merluccius merluccius]
MDVYKLPVTDPSKRSKKGRLSLRRNSDGFLETVEGGLGKPEEDLLVPVFENGSLLQDYTLDEIRKNAQLTEEDEAIPAQHNRDQKPSGGHIINGVH